MRDSSIQNMYSVDPVSDRGGTVIELWKHASADHAFPDQPFCFRRCKPGNERAFIINIPVKPFNIRQEHQLIRSHRLCNGAGCIIRIDIIGAELIIQPDRRYNGQK